MHAGMDLHAADYSAMARENRSVAVIGYDED
jgi:hypothetical protein